MDEVAVVLQHYPLTAISRVEALGNAGGFSGARLWRIHSEGVTYCLRAWPREQSIERLQFIHHVLAHVQDVSQHVVAYPLLSRAGDTIVHLGGRFWELSHWMPGQADYHAEPTEEKLIAAVTHLALFHEVVRDCPKYGHAEGKSTAVHERLRIIDRLRRGGRQQIGEQWRPGGWPQLDVRIPEVLQRFDQEVERVRCALEPFAATPLPLQVVIRDIWHDHVLFTGGRVTGIVDMGGLRFDTVALDLARLVGSLARTAEDWQVALAAYQQVRSLPDPVRRLVAVFDASFHALAGMSWLQWICVEGRRFENREGVLTRVDAILAHPNCAGGVFE